MAKSHGYEGIDEIMAGYFPEDEVARQAEGMTPYQMVRRGWTLMEGRDGEARNLRVAALWFDRAARNGYDDAWVYRGRALTLQGLHDQAFAAYREGADQGNIDCMGILGRCYAKGLGCEQDKERAMDWWDKAYHRFHPRAGKMMTKLNPVAARKRMAQYMIDNMKMCIDLDFRFDDVNVRKLADELIDHEEYDTARTLLRRCVSTIANNVGGSDLYEDVLVQLAWVYFMDGKATTTTTRPITTPAQPTTSRYSSAMTTGAATGARLSSGLLISSTSASPTTRTMRLESWKSTSAKIGTTDGHTTILP